MTWAMLEKFQENQIQRFGAPPSRTVPHAWQTYLYLCNREAKLLLGLIPQAQGCLVNSDQGIRQTES